MNILMIGNSFCYYYVDELYGMLAAAGYKNVNICNVYYSGCPLKKHWTWWKNGESNYQLFSTTENGRVQVSNACDLDFCLDYANWDIISLQESSGSIRSLSNGDPEQHLENTRQYRAELWTHIRKRFPNARHLWHQSWSVQVGYDRNGYQMTSLAQQEADMLKMKAFSLATCKEFALERVNTGEAWQYIRKGGYDNLCARLSKKDGEGDYYHDGDVGGGQYLNACVWFEAITGESCVGNSYIPAYTTSKDLTDKLDKLQVEATEDGYRLTDAFIATLQNAAHGAIAQRDLENAN